MTVLFDNDPFPGKPRILFIGPSNSTHTQAWIELLNNSKINVRLFSTPFGVPPSHWNIRTYISGFYWGRNDKSRKYLYQNTTLGNIKFFINKFFQYALPKINHFTNLKPELWLAQIIKDWRPDIIHTLGFFDDQGGLLYYETRKRYQLEGLGKWVLQLRGGSDLTLRRHNPIFKETILDAFNQCDQIISDNLLNIKFSVDLGVSPEKFANITPVPGSGGLHFDENYSKDLLPPSKRQRIMLWPKGYEAQWSKALPILEAIKIIWSDIQPCEIYILAISSEVREWCLSLPEYIQQNLHIYGRIPRNDVFKLMKEARIMLAPSLIDGIPNSLYEAMAYGSFPIVSPLETIISVVEEYKNVFFARNLFPNEIAEAIKNAMEDDDLIDNAALNNLKLVKKIANRQTITSQVVSFYTELLGIS